MSAERRAGNRQADVVSDIQIPLDNLAYTVQAYLLANGPRLDTDTRFLLAGIRDCADRIAGSVRRASFQTQQPQQQGRATIPVLPAVRRKETA